MTDHLRAIAHRALASRPAQRRYLPDSRHAEREGLVLSGGTALPGPRFNKVTVFGATPPPERVLALAGEFFGDPDGFGVMVDADEANPIEEVLRAGGWQVIDEEPGMVLPVIPDPPPAPTGLTICPVTDDVTLRDFWNANDPPPPESGAPSTTIAPAPFTNLTQFFNPSLACALDPDIALFVGYADGRPVATSAFYRVHNIAEIGAVATAPAYRRRGFGAALAWAAVVEGHARGCTTAALRATEMGYPVYLKMGFEVACRLRIYAPNPLAPSPPARRGRQARGGGLRSVFW